MTPVVEINRLNVSFGKQQILKSLSCQIMPRDFFIIYGENGVGKSTLIKALLGMIKAQSGKIKRPSLHQIGYVPQFRNIDTEYPLSIKEFVALNYHTAFVPWQTRHEKVEMHKVLDQTRLTTIENLPLGLASGGEKQHAYLAQAIINRPQLLILDEATASLDSYAKYELLDIVAKLRQQGLTIIFITHDWALAKHYGTNFLHLTKNGFHIYSAEEISKMKEER